MREPSNIKMFPDSLELQCRHCRYRLFEVALVMENKEIYVKCGGCRMPFRTGAVVPDDKIRLYRPSDGIIITPGEGGN